MMMKKTLSAVALCAALLIGGCGTAGIDKEANSNPAAKDGRGSIETVDGREIIAQLNQTAEETPKRDQAAQDQLASPEYTEGYFGEPSKELEEDMAVQAIEGPAAIAAVEEVYGGGDGFDKEGVLFFENQAQGAAQSGVWIGVKSPDDRVQQVLDLLQPKVDSGEITAEPIYIFRSPHTQYELQVQQDEVAKAVDALKKDRGSFSVSVDTISGAITVGHDFLKEDEQKKIKQQFPEYALHFEQEGNMVAEPGQSAVIEPETPVTETPLEEGGFVMDVSDGSFFVVGGTEGAVDYSFAEADRLKVGQRVKVEGTGGIMESYPAQGEATFVEILPDYQPAGAVLSESQAVKKAIQQNTSDFIVIEKVSYEKAQNEWNLVLDDESVVVIEDR